jgi:hypothetical protein
MFPSKQVGETMCTYGAYIFRGDIITLAIHGDDVISPFLCSYMHCTKTTTLCPYSILYID